MIHEANQIAAIADLPRIKAPERINETPVAVSPLSDTDKALMAQLGAADATEAYDRETRTIFQANFDRIFGKGHSDDVQPSCRHCQHCGRPLTQGLCDKCDFTDLPPSAA